MSNYNPLLKLYAVQPYQRAPQNTLDADVALTLSLSLSKRFFPAPLPHTLTVNVLELPLLFDLAETFLHKTPLY